MKWGDFKKAMDEFITYLNEQGACDLNNWNIFVKKIDADVFTISFNNRRFESYSEVLEKRFTENRKTPIVRDDEEVKEKEETMWG